MIPVRSQWGRYNLPRSIELFGIWRFTKVCGSPPHCPTEVLLSLTGPTNAPLHTPVACKHHAATSQIFAEYDPMRISWGYRQAKWYCNSGWWFQPLWKILVGWDYSSHIICIYIYGKNPNVPKTTNQHKWYPLLSSTIHRPSHAAYLQRVSKDLLSFHRVFAMIVPMDNHGLSENWVTSELMIFPRLRGPFFDSGKHIKQNHWKSHFLMGKLWKITLFNV